MINKLYFNTIISGISVVAVTQLLIGVRFIGTFMLGDNELMQLLYGVAAISGGLFTFGFYYILKMVLFYFEKHNQVMETTSPFNTDTQPF